MTTEPLAGRRILLPPSRLEPNPLVTMLQRKGAEAVLFPALTDCPVEVAPLDDAARRIGEFDWVVFVGGQSAARFCERLATLRIETGALRGQVASIGFRALRVLRAAGIEVTQRPVDHTPGGIAAVMAPVAGKRVLIVRALGTSERFPALLREHGATVEIVHGHGLSAVPDAEAAQEAFKGPLDLVAFANPATVRLFAEAMAALPLAPERCLGGVPILAIGPTTAEAAVEHGLPADLVAGGRLKALVQAILDLTAASHSNAL